MDTRITIAIAALYLVMFAPNAVQVCADSALLSPSTNDKNSIHQENASFESSPRELTTGRQLQTCRRDDALDPTRPGSRASLVRDSREDAVTREFKGSRGVCQDISEDTDTAAKFHKTLPHDALGQVDTEAYSALRNCILEGDFDTCEGVPSGDSSGFLINPIAGFGIDLAGAASSSMSAPAAPTLDSPELAAQLAECYWMALARDVPFSQYDMDDVTVTAADVGAESTITPLAANLAEMPGFSSATGVAVGQDGSVDPSSQLFRASFVGVETGPMISQLLVNDFTLDSIRVSPRQTTFVPGVDYMTDYDEWLRIQNGGAPTGSEATDSTQRYIRNARDLARLVATDTIYTEAFRGTLILLGQGAISKAGFNGPYVDSSRQKGFVNFGVSHVMRLLGSGEASQRTSWYQKWQVHQFARPEALAGTVHNTLNSALNAPIDASLLENMELLVRVAAANGAQNSADGLVGETYLLSQATMGGSPSHPSYPAGHAVQNGAFATMLKALVGLDRGEDCFTDPVFPDDDGLELLPYTGDCLTFGGEINKLATNVAIGRQMMGVHYRFDSTEGLVLGETVAIRLLHQELMTYPEQFPYEFRLFTGETINLNPDGTFGINGQTCDGDIYTGVEDC